MGRKNYCRKPGANIMSKEMEKEAKKSRGLHRLQSDRCYRQKKPQPRRKLTASTQFRWTPELHPAMAEPYIYLATNASINVRNHIVLKLIDGSKNSIRRRWGMQRKRYRPTNTESACCALGADATVLSTKSRLNEKKAASPPCVLGAANR